MKTAVAMFLLWFAYAPAYAYQCYQSWANNCPPAAEIEVLWAGTSLTHDSYWFYWDRYAPSCMNYNSIIEFTTDQSMRSLVYSSTLPYDPYCEKELWCSWSQCYCCSRWSVGYDAIFLENGSTWYYRIFHAYPGEWARGLPSEVDWFESAVGGAPETPSLRWPRDGDNAGGTTINFEWNVPRYGLDHSIEIECEDRRLVSGRIGVVGSNGPGVPGQPLSSYRVDDLFFDNGESCRWRIAGINKLYAGPYSSWASFTNGPGRAPEPSRIDSPTPGQEFSDKCVDVAFTQELRANEFKILISPTPNFSEIAIEKRVGRLPGQYVQTQHLCLPQDAAGGDYYLIVVALNGVGETPSDVRLFKIKRQELCPFRESATGKDLYGRVLEDLHFCFNPDLVSNDYSTRPYLTLDTFYRRVPPPLWGSGHNHNGAMETSPGNELSGSIAAVRGWSEEISDKDRLCDAFEVAWPWLGSNSQLAARMGATANKWAGMIYEYWRNVHQTSLSPTSTMLSIVGQHTSFYGINSNGEAINCRFEDNADSDAGTVAFSGPGPKLLNIESSADVAWHEWGHNLFRAYGVMCGGFSLAECGALHEAVGDLTATAAAAYWGWNDPWLIGDDLPNSPVLRNLRNPSDPNAGTQLPVIYKNDNYWFPHRGDQVLGCSPAKPTCATENDPPVGGDDCGVHKNSGVFSRAFLCMAEGCYQNGVWANAWQLGVRWTYELALKSAQKCWRDRSPNFSEAATCMYDTAGDPTLFGPNSPQQRQVLLSFQAVGIPVNTPAPTPTPTPTPIVVCAGDCDRGGAVTVDEILTMVAAILGQSTSSACAPGDYNGDGEITIDELTRAIWASLGGYCSTLLAANTTSQTAGTGGAPSAIQADWVQGVADASAITHVTLKNTDGQVTALQFDLGLPDGLFDQRRCKKNPFLPHSFYQNGNRFVLAATDDPTAALPDVFPVMACSYRIVATAEPGAYPVTLENVVASTSTGERLDLATMSGGLRVLPADGSMPSLAGNISYYSGGQPVSGGDVELQGPIRKSVSTEADGGYQSSTLLPGEWKITPRKNGDQGSGISALDAVYVLQAAVGLRTLTPEQQLACDVSGNGALGALDAAYILQRIVGILGQFPAAGRCGSDWLFIPQPSGTAQTVSPVLNSSSCTMGSITRQVGGAVTGQDFRAILLGDCTGNWTPPAGAGSLALARRFVLDNSSEDTEYGRKTAGRALRYLDRVSSPDASYEQMSRWDQKRVDKALRRLTRYFPTPTPTPRW